MLERRGFGDTGDRSDTFAEATPVLAGLAVASVQGLVALGDAPENLTPLGPGACHAQWQGFEPARRSRRAGRPVRATRPWARRSCSSPMPGSRRDALRGANDGVNLAPPCQKPIGVRSSRRLEP